MKKRYVLPVLTLLFLFLGIVPVHAETEDIKTESVTLTEDNRYNPEYYKKPEVRYPAAKTRTYSVDRSAQTLEEYIVAALENFETEIDVYDYKIPESEASSSYFQIVNSHPELFYVGNRVGLSFRSSGGNTVVTKYRPTYNGTSEEIVQQKKAFEIAADQALAQVESTMSDLEKALVVHDYLVQNCEYDYERYLANPNSVPAISHTAYGGLVEKMAVCDGYGKAYAYIMNDKLGIPCELVSSDAMNHAWNMIQIGGEWYHVDATWDDPTWDSIGRVVHTYFLLSDGAISDATHKHSGWATTRTASSTLYDTEYWSEINSAFYHNQGTWYYSQYQEESRKTSLLKRSDLLSGTAENVYTESATWNNYNNSYMYLTKNNGTIYFNTPTAIKRLDADDTVTEVYKPTIPSGQVIFGFTVRGEQLCYALQATPNLTSKQEILTYTLPELQLLEIEGVTAEKVSAVYDGTAKRIELKGAQAGDIIQYAGADGVFLEEQPELIDAGTYQVLYKVQRTGYQTLYGDVQVEIEKAVPEYTVPTGLGGWSGSPLASVSMPSGFSWMDSSTKMYREGTHKYLAKYVPSDQNNYQIVTDIEVEVTVKCPKAGSGHQYKSEITKEPTETEKGERTYTCEICGDTRVEDIYIDLPEIQGIHVENVKTVYNGHTQGITVEGIQTGDIVQYAGEDKVYGENQPEMINAGSYLVLYKVEREGYQIFYGRANVEIEKAVPEYTMPADLKGISGTTLEKVELPEGFVWQTDPQTKLYQEGKVVYLANYTPKNLDNYVTVENIEIEVTVKCPGHQYTSEVTKEPTDLEKGEETYTCHICGDTYVKEIEPEIQECPHQYQEVITKKATETSKGLKTFTCSLCGDSYTEENPLLAPRKPANVSVLKVKKNTAKSLSFSWKKVNDVNYRLVFYKGSKKVSTKYLTGSSYTYTKLKAATEYTLKVTPYSVVNGKKVYANAVKQVKTATAPAAVKLSSVKKTGSAKVKLTWKKTTGATGYEIFMKTNKAGYKKVKSIAKVKTVSYTKTGLKKGKTYSFRLRAYKTVNGSKIYGAYSNVKKIKFR